MLFPESSAIDKVEQFLELSATSKRVEGYLSDGFPEVVDSQQSVASEISWRSHGSHCMRAIRTEQRSSIFDSFCRTRREICNTDHGFDKYSGNTDTNTLEEAECSFLDSTFYRRGDYTGNSFVNSDTEISEPEHEALADVTCFLLLHTSTGSSKVLIEGGSNTDLGNGTSQLRSGIEESGQGITNERSSTLR